MRSLIKKKNSVQTHHEAQHQRADALANLRWDVIAELLQCSEKTLQLAELPRSTGRRELLVGKRGGGWRWRAIAESVRWRRCSVQGRGRVTGAVCYWKARKKQSLQLSITTKHFLSKSSRVFSRLGRFGLIKMNPVVTVLLLCKCYHINTGEDQMSKPRPSRQVETFWTNLGFEVWT